MKCQVKYKFDQNEKQKTAIKTLAESLYKEMSNVSTCLNLLVLAQLYPVSWYSAGQTTEATASDHPDTGSLSELYWQPSSAMQIPTSTWAGPSLALPIHLYSVSLPPGTLTHTVPLFYRTPHAATLIWNGGGLGLKTNRLGWRTRWQSWRRATTGCFHSCLLSVTLLSLPSSTVYCISLVLIFADKCWLSCCAAPLPSLWTLHQSKARSALQMSSPWFHHTISIVHR